MKFGKITSMRGRDYVHLAIFLFIKKIIQFMLSKNPNSRNRHTKESTYPGPSPGVLHTDHSRNALCTGGGSSVSLIRNDAGRVYGERGLASRAVGVAGGLELAGLTALRHTALAVALLSSISTLH